MTFNSREALVHVNCYGTQFTSWQEVKDFFVLPLHSAFYRTNLTAWVGQRVDGTWQIDLSVPYLAGTQSFYGENLEAVRSQAIAAGRYWEAFADGTLPELDDEKGYPFYVRIPYVDGYRTLPRPGVRFFGRYQLSYSRSSQRCYGTRENQGKWGVAYGDNNEGCLRGEGYTPAEVVEWGDRRFLANGKEISLAEYKALTGAASLS